jgi:Bax protein
MKIIKLFMQAVNRDKSYLIAVVITICLVSILFSKHNWNKGKGAVETFKAVSLTNNTHNNVTSENKIVFLEILRPYIRQENNKIAHDRVFLEKLVSEYNQSSHHNAATLRKLKRLASRYYLKMTDLKGLINELRLRIDFIPESLLLALAAHESLWGTSHLAKQTNNLFAVSCFNSGCGLSTPPLSSDASNKLKRFDSFQASVVSFMKALNSDKSYEQFRRIRSQLRSQNQTITGIKLTQGLVSGSVSRQNYIKTIAALIRENKLE